MDSIEELQTRLEAFRNNRDWAQFHTPKNLILALAGEIGELASLVQWKDDSNMINDAKLRKAVSEEMADVFIYLINLASKLEINLIEVADLKVTSNSVRYPIDKCKGKSDKAEDL